MGDRETKVILALGNCKMEYNAFLKDVVERSAALLGEKKVEKVI